MVNSEGGVRARRGPHPAGAADADRPGESHQLPRTLAPRGAGARERGGAGARERL